MRRLLIVLFVVAATFSGTARAQFCPGVTPWVFDDVPAADPFCGYITYMATAGITTGCFEIDANHRLYCPNDFVTRKQMAAFMFRLRDDLFPPTCAPGQIMKWDGTTWSCADDEAGSSAGGTVMSIAAATGLEAIPNPITTTGGIGIAPTYQLPQGCGSNQIPKWNGSAWTCGADAAGTGTLTSLSQGTGIVLTPNPVTSSGLVAVDTAYVQRRVVGSCPSGSSIRVIDLTGTVTCETDDVGAGTVTSVSAGTGLTGGTITGSGTIAADTNYLQRRVSTTCAAGSSIRAIAADGTVTCETDDIGAGTVTSITAGTGLAGGTITGVGTISADTTYVQRRVTGTCAAGSSIRVIGEDGTVICETDEAGPTNAFVLGGNGFGATAVLGTTDNQALDMRVNGSRVQRFEPNAISPNMIGGHPANTAGIGVRGATIGGGGTPSSDADPEHVEESPNRVLDNYGTIGGGYNNQAGDGAGTTADMAFATIAGGRSNSAWGPYTTIAGGSNNEANTEGSTVGGGSHNKAGVPTGTGFATVGGGYNNSAHFFGSTVSGGQDNVAESPGSAIGGGQQNSTWAMNSTVAGGYRNEAYGPVSTIVGGGSNKATGHGATVGGGVDNWANGDYSWAGGQSASALHEGAFVWSDSYYGNWFSSDTPHEFAVRSSGGVRFVTAVDSSGTPTWTCGVSGGAGGSWGCSSDHTLKRELVLLDGVSTLAKVAQLPIYTWIAKGDERRTPHAGPTAQDFMAAFGLGDNDKMIGFADAQGVLFSAVQGLNAKLEKREAALRAELQSKDAEVAALKRELADLRLAVQGLVAQTSAEGRIAQAR